MGILTTCKPRADVLSGDLKDAIFAADFGDVVSNHPGTPEVYRDPQLFFRNTHPARDLIRIVREVFSALSKDGEPGLALRLSTGFGGGKTHTDSTAVPLSPLLADVRAIGVELFSQQVLQDLHVERPIGQNSLDTTVLMLKRSQALHLIVLEATVLSPPVVERLPRDPVRLN